MRTLNFIAIVTIFCCSVAVAIQRNSEEVRTKISSVTVYRDRALITRTGRADVSAGLHEFTISGLPVSMIDQSVRVSGEGTANAKLIDVKINVTPLSSMPSDSLPALQKTLRKLQYQLRTLQDKSQILSEQLSLLKELVTVSSSGKQSDGKRISPSKDDVEKLLDLYGTQSTKYKLELSTLDEKQGVLAESIHIFTAKIKEMEADRQRPEKEIIVKIDARSAGIISFTITHLSNGTSWSPQYDIRGSSVNDSIEIAYYCSITQNTGEDWNDVSLSIATSQPSTAQVLPKLVPWYLSLLQQHQRMPAGDATFLRGGRSSLVAVDVDGDNVAHTTSVADQVAPMDVQLAKTYSNSFSSFFTIPGKSTVIHGDANQKFSIATLRLKGEPKYSSVPKVSPDVMLTSSVTNNSDYPIIAGNANIFLDNAYICGTELPNVVAGDKFDVLLGVDQSIRIQKKLAGKMSESSGIFTQDKKISYDFAISLENLKSIPVHVTVRDNIPVSQDENIKVKLETPKKSDVLVDESGVITWELEMKPGERKTLPLKFSVVFPPYYPIQGLE